MRCLKGWLPLLARSLSFSSPKPQTFYLNPLLLLSSNCSARLQDFHASRLYQQRGGTELRPQRQQVPDCKHRFECYQTDLGLETDQEFSIHVYN